MRVLPALCLGLSLLTAAVTGPVSAAAPVPPESRAPVIEGKYVMVLNTTGRSVGGPGGGGFGGGPPGRGVPARVAVSTSTNRREVVVTKDTITIDGNGMTWEYRIDPSVKPMAIDLTLVPVLGKKVKVAGIIEVSGDRLTIAHAEEGAERPKDFEKAEGVTAYVFQKAPPPPRPEYRIVALRPGKEADAEKAINQLAKDGFEVALTTTPTADSVVYFVLKRVVTEGGNK